jgi:hypothetical protein
MAALAGTTSALAIPFAIDPPHGERGRRRGRHVKRTLTLVRALAARAVVLLGSSRVDGGRDGSRNHPRTASCRRSSAIPEPERPRRSVVTATTPRPRGACPDPACPALRRAG